LCKSYEEEEKAKQSEELNFFLSATLLLVLSRNPQIQKDMLSFS
jgi:hypothetical protein